LGSRSGGDEFGTPNELYARLACHVAETFVRTAKFVNPELRIRQLNQSGLSKSRLAQVKCGRPLSAKSKPRSLKSITARTGVD
jgi:hypothetical protein